MRRTATVVTGLLAIALGVLAIVAPYAPLDRRALAVALPLAVVGMSVAGLLGRRPRRRP